MAADGSIKIDTKLDTKGAEDGIKTLESKLESTSQTAKKIGGNMTKYLTAPILALGGIAFAAADDMDKAYRNIRVGTGAVGDDLEELKESFKTVFAGVPDSADDVSNALANLNTFTGATEEGLEGLTKSVLDASRLLGEDGVQNSENFGQAMAQWQIPVEDGVSELDKLFQITQDYGIGLGTLTDGLNRYGSVMQNAGFTMDETAEFMGGMNKAGIDVRRTMPGITKAFSEWTDEGKNAKDEFDKLTKRIVNNKESQEDLALVTEMMGDRAGNQLVTAIKSGAVPAIDELGDSLADAGGLIDETSDDTKTIGEQFAELKNQAQIGLEPLGQVLLDLAKDALPPLIEQVTKFAEWMSNLSPETLKMIAVIGGLVAAIGPLMVGIGMVISAFTTILPIIKAVGAGIALLTSPIGLVVAAIVALVAIVFIYWEDIWEFTKEVFSAIGEFFVETWEWITELFTDFFVWLAETWDAFWTGTKELVVDIFISIAEFFIETWEWIKEIFFTAIDWIVTYFTESWTDAKERAVELFTSIGDFFSNFWKKTKELFSKTVDSIVGFLSDNWNWAKDTTIKSFKAIANFFTTIFEKIRNTISTIISKVRSTISSVWSGIKSITESVFGGIRSFFNSIFSSIGRAAQTFASVFSRVWNSIKEGAQAVARPIAAVLNGIMSGIEAVINGIAGAVNSLPSFDIPSWVPLGLGGKSFGIPNIPTVSLPRVPSLDVGTNFVASDGLAMLHAGEAVVPAEHNGPYESGGGIVIENVMLLDNEVLANSTIDLTDKKLSDRVRLESYMRGDG